MRPRSSRVQVSDLRPPSRTPRTTGGCASAEKLNRRSTELLFTDVGRLLIASTSPAVERQTACPPVL